MLTCLLLALPLLGPSSQDPDLRGGVVVDADGVAVAGARVLLVDALLTDAQVTPLLELIPDDWPEAGRYVLELAG